MKMNEDTISKTWYNNEDVGLLLRYLDSLSRLHSQGVKVEREVNLVTARINELFGLKK